MTQIHSSANISSRKDIRKILALVLVAFAVSAILATTSYLIWLKSKPTLNTSKKLFEIVVNVRPGASSPLPAEVAGAFVVCYVPADSIEDAAHIAVIRLKADGYLYNDLRREYRLIDPNAWTDYIESTWSEFKDRLPSQQQVIRLMNRNQFFYGPVITYEHE